MSTVPTATVNLTGNASVNGVVTPGAVVTITKTPQGGLPVTLPAVVTDASGNFAAQDLNVPSGVYVYEATSPAIVGQYNSGDSGPQTVDVTLPTLLLSLTVTVSASAGAASATVTATAKA